jgi:protein-disulfide isomerase
MHDTLFENQDRLADPYLVGYANAIGLDLERFTSDLATHVHLPKVRDDFMSGVRSGVNGTPTFYINDFRHDDSWDYASLATALRRVGVDLRA